MQMLVAAVVLFILFRRTYAILVHRRRLKRAAQGSAQQQPSAKSAVPVDHWTAVASQDIFQQTAIMVGRSQILVYIIVAASTGMATAAQVRNLMASYNTEDYMAEVAASCCPACAPEGVSLSGDGCECDLGCELGYKTLASFLTLNVGMLISVMTSMMFIPLSLWSPVADAAFSHPSSCKPHHTLLRRTRMLPIPVASFCTVVTVVIGIYAARFLLLPSPIGGPPLWWAVLLANCTTAVGSIFMLVWTAGPRRLLALPAYVARICFYSAKGLVSGGRSVQPEVGIRMPPPFPPPFPADLLNLSSVPGRAGPGFRGRVS